MGGGGDRWGEREELENAIARRFGNANEQVKLSGWPWGTHETKLLRELAAAAERFWMLYDSTDATTAPTNETVSKWLEDRGVSNRTAETMASILRPDGLRPGPRK